MLDTGRAFPTWVWGWGPPLMWMDAGSAMSGIWGSTWERNRGSGWTRRSYEKDMEEEFFYVGSRLVQGVSLKEFEERFGERAQEIFIQVAWSGWRRKGPPFFRAADFCLTDYGMDVSNYVMAEFLQ